MTLSRGIGRGGARDGAGRPPGSIDRKARNIIIEAEREGKLLPLDFLLAVMRDPEMTLRDRTFAAVASAPYVHARRTLMKVVSNPDELSDEELVAQVAQHERYLAELPEGERAAFLDNQLTDMLDTAQRLSRDRQRAFFRELAEAGENGLAQLAEPVPPLSVIRMSNQHILTRPPET
jgi:hypothetical protein